MKEKYIPCPFCGGFADSADELIFVQINERSGKNEFFGLCDLCCAAGPLGDSPEEALALWNGRMFIPEGAVESYRALVDRSSDIDVELCAQIRILELLDKAGTAIKVLNELSGIDEEIKELLDEATKARADHMAAYRAAKRGSLPS